MNDLDIYKEGSEACRNYIRLTIQVRTHTQQKLMATVAAIAVAILAKGTLSDKVDYTFLGYILLCTGIVPGCFSASLALIDWHYQSAFTAIRDALDTNNRKPVTTQTAPIRPRKRNDEWDKS